MSRWFIVVPPLGAARQVGLNVIEAFGQNMPQKQFKVFDTAKYLSGFSSILSKPDPDMVADLANQTFAVQCFDFAPTHVLVLALSPITLFTLKLLRRYSITTIHWFYEDFRRALYWKDILDGYDFFLAVQQGPLAAACEAAKTSYHFVPTAIPSVVALKHTAMLKTYDLCFIGIASAYRARMLEHLVSSGFTVAIAGSNWDRYHGLLQSSIVTGKWIDEEAARNLFASSRIGLNLSFDDFHLDPENAQISPRVFDILASNTVLLTEDVPLLHKTIGDCSIKTFTNADDLVANARLICADYANWEQLIRTNNDKVLQTHTYKHRVEQIIAITSRG